MFDFISTEVAYFMGGILFIIICFISFGLAYEYLEAKSREIARNRVAKNTVPPNELAEHVDELRKRLNAAESAAAIYQSENRRYSGEYARLNKAIRRRNAYIKKLTKRKNEAFELLAKTKKEQLKKKWKAERHDRA